MSPAHRMESDRRVYRRLLPDWPGMQAGSIRTDGHLIANPINRTDRFAF